jgi:hypothetical protein
MQLIPSDTTPSDQEPYKDTNRQQDESRSNVSTTLVHGMHLGALSAGAFFKMPQKSLV